MFTRDTTVTYGVLRVAIAEGSLIQIVKSDSLNDGAYHRMEICLTPEEVRYLIHDLQSHLDHVEGKCGSDSPRQEREGITSH